MPTTHYEFMANEKPLTLNRLPKSRTLKAWDAGDEYLLKLLAEQSDAKPLLIVNDNFGALALAVSEPVLLSWSDSYMAQLATLANAQANGIMPPALAGCDQSLQHCLAPLQEPVRILMRVPKTQAFFEWQLRELAAFAPADSELWLAGMDKHLSKSQFDLLDKIMANARFLPGVKKARVWQAEIPAASADAPAQTQPLLQAGFEFDLNHKQGSQHFTLVRTPNVFSGSKADQGALFFIQQFSALAPTGASPIPKVADLGCGNGLLSLCYSALYPQSEIIAVDESFQAIACARANVEQVAQQIQHPIMTQCGNALEDFPAHYFDTILCNPPFHQQMTVGTELAYAILQSAKRALRPGGKIYLVGNRHLQHHITLKKLFGHCSTIASNNKFVVLSAEKRAE